MINKMLYLKLFNVCLFFLIFYSCTSENKDSAKKTTLNSEKSSVPEKIHPGKMIYMQFCLACHMENGEGVPGLYPPLTQTDYILGDKKKLIDIVLQGKEGLVAVKGIQYNNVMAKLDYLQDQQIADVLTYVRTNFGNNAESVSAEEVKMVRNTGIN